ncbi:hypothetical protein DF3PB_1120002 [uncultured Defluviicoccus sp.]|uniref:Cryptochrome/DNA photolyase FAD-binding domain-containing protein n=1 Tax=metagenome TaxID=256318 RepID=A0A380TA40_9ZZZZ|nr:hypothetical protein DF3PB_1120002 [uncultured Defluviicoccus sp.]
MASRGRSGVRSRPSYGTSRRGAGYPIVDVGMRELWATGWLRNRARIIVASFLIKDLLLPWMASCGALDRGTRISRSRRSIRPTGFSHRSGPALYHHSAIPHMRSR